jgi:hypothetical protein
MKRHFSIVLKAVTVGSMALALIACGEGSKKGFTKSSSSISYYQQAGGAHGSIKGSVGGSSYNYGGDMRYTSAGAGKRNLQVVDVREDENSWNIYALSQSQGTYQCAKAALQIVLVRKDEPTLTTQMPGSCSITVTRADSEIIEGVFDATLAGASGSTYAVSNGSFRIELAHAIPDLDEDGFSDADDNCPFISNSDQSDADDNGTGDACEPG